MEAEARRARDERIPVIRSLRTAHLALRERLRQGSDPPRAKPGGSSAADSSPKFGNLWRYGFFDDDEAQLWEVEFDRLVTGLDEAPKTIQDASSTSPTIWAEDISPVGFAQLERLSDQVFCALAICCLDDQVVISDFGQARTPLMF